MRIRTFLFVSTLLAAGSLSAAQITLGQNAILNGDAESGLGSSDGGIVAVPNWTPTGQFTAIQWGAAGGFPANTDPGPAARGLNLFAGGPSSALSTGSQTVDVSNIFTQIDSSSVSYNLSGYLGGFATQADNAVLTASFLGVSSTIGSISIGPVTASDRSSATGLLFRSTSGVIPIGTRSITFELALTRLEGSYDDGYADNLSFVATSSTVPPPTVPEPAMVALFSSGLGVILIATLLRRRVPRSETV